LEIKCRIDDDGILSVLLRIELKFLYSPKHEIGRWDRSRTRDFYDLVRLMSDPDERDKLQPIEISVVSAKFAKYLTPIADVVVNPMDDEAWGTIDDNG